MSAPTSKSNVPGDAAPPTRRWVGDLAAVWGIGVLLSAEVTAVVKLSGPAWVGVRGAHRPAHYLFLGVNLLLFLGLKGYWVFQRRVAPRVVARAWALRRSPRLLDGLLAPLYCMALMRAGPRRLLFSWGLVAFIVTAVVILSHVDQPWRGMVDAGVALGLAWGAGSILVLTLRALAGRVPVLTRES